MQTRQKTFKMKRKEIKLFKEEEPRKVYHGEKKVFGS